MSEPAFPTKNYRAMVPESSGYSEGMTLRDYFAAKVFAVLCTPSEDDPEYEDWSLGFMADHAYRAADAMLQARSE